MNFDNKKNSHFGWKKLQVANLKMAQYIFHIGSPNIYTKVKLLKIVHCASIIIPNPEGFLSTHRNCYYCFPTTPSSIPVLPILILPTPWMRCGVIYVVVGKSLKRGQFLGFYAKIVIFRGFFFNHCKETCKRKKFQNTLISAFEVIFQNVRLFFNFWTTMWVCRCTAIYALPRYWKRVDMVFNILKVT